MALEALIFDVDGTLADTEEAHRQAFNRAFGIHGLDWDWDRARYRALLDVTGGKERLRHHIATLGLSAAARARLDALVGTLHEEKTRQYGAILGQGEVKLRTGVARLLEEAVQAGCKLAIASTTTAANIDALLHSTLGPRGLDMFSVIACGDQVRAKKPAPDVYRLALHNLGLHPEHAVAFEDSAHGLHAALGAGLYTVVTPTFWTTHSDFSGASLLLPDLGDPALPLPGEPGTALQQFAWLGLNELEQRHGASGRRSSPTELSA
jgi:beta-phosphoglucomutase-like phosphatase (HAD superfamily)